MGQSLVIPVRWWARGAIDSRVWLQGIAAPTPYFAGMLYKTAQKRQNENKTIDKNAHSHPTCSLSTILMPVRPGA